MQHAIKSPDSSLSKVYDNVDINMDMMMMHAVCTTQERLLRKTKQGNAS